MTSISQVSSCRDSNSKLLATSGDCAFCGWDKLESRYRELKRLLNAPSCGFNASSSRAEQQKSASVAIISLLESAQHEARKALLQGFTRVATEGGIHVLKLKEDYYGQNTLQLVPCYFHLARTHQHCDKLKTAEEFLSLAHWIILQNPTAEPSLKAELHHLYGLLYSADSKLDAALKQLTCATYYLSVSNGPESIMTSLCYFDLGSTFAAKGAIENTMACYDKVKDIWGTHLPEVLRARVREQQQQVEKNASFRTTESLITSDKIPFSTPMQLGEENMEDAVKMLRAIFGMQKERYGYHHPEVCRAEYILGMFYLFNYDTKSAQPHLLRALELAKRLFGPYHDKTCEMKRLILENDIAVPDDTSYTLEEEVP